MACLLANTLIGLENRHRKKKSVIPHKLKNGSDLKIRLIEGQMAVVHLSKWCTTARVAKLAEHRESLRHAVVGGVAERTPQNFLFSQTHISVYLRDVFH